jgi:hypothetical protein
MRILGVVSSSSREVPGAPTIGTATDVGTARAFNNGAATVTFTAPAFDGGLPITGYTVTSSPGGFTGTGASSPITVTGLQSGTSYTFTVVATNSRGNSSPSAASNSITATTVPQAPTIGTATDGGTGSTVSVAFTGNATGGKAITTYTATSSPGGLTGTGASSPITVSGLTAGTAYTFTVTATNANGTSTASAASNSVTPASPTSYESIASFTPTSGNSVTFSSIPQTYKSLQIRANFFATGTQANMQVNGVTSNYWSHWFGGNDFATTYVNYTNGGSLRISGNDSQATSTFASVAIVDLIDYASTSKLKTIRVITGCDSNGGSSGGDVSIRSNLYQSTNAITSILINCVGMVAGTTISLYGIKG